MIDQTTSTHCEGYLGGPAPDGYSAECGIVEPDSDGAILPYFGTLAFEYCRTRYIENGTVMGPSGIGNVYGGSYNLYYELDSNAAQPCYTVSNFTDSNNWTFSIVKNNAPNLAC